MKTLPVVMAKQAKKEVPVETMISAPGHDPNDKGAIGEVKINNSQGNNSGHDPTASQTAGVAQE